MKALIADDDSTTRRILGSCVEKMGVPVIYASNGRRAWEVLMDNPEVGLLIVDIQMPELDGRGFLTQVRNDRYFAQLPVMIISGVVSLNQIVDLMESGASCFLPKPIEIQEFKRYVRSLLESKLEPQKVERIAQ